MNTERTASFVALGAILSGIVKSDSKEIYASATRLKEYIPRAIYSNGWFEAGNIEQAILAIADMLSTASLHRWVEKYKITEHEPKRVGVLLAGNIPLVGFHDFMCVLCSGNKFIGKLSSKDDRLLPLLANVLIDIDPSFSSQIEFTNGTLDNIDAIIATGSDNTSKHIEFYFGNYPNIIRKNRNAIAVIDGSESEEELVALGHDIFDYFGLGCRSVSKVYVPQGYDLDHIFKGLFPYKDVVSNKKYGNNYDYYKAIYLMAQTKLIENGFILLKEDQQIASPVAVLHYEYYSDFEVMLQTLNVSRDQIQCVISTKPISGFRTVPFGKAQSPAVDDYADGIDTLDFLTTLG